MEKYYNILGLNADASPAEIKEAYRDLVKVWHPDRFRNENLRLQQKTNERLKEINDAYDKLKGINFEKLRKTKHSSSGVNEPDNSDNHIIRCPSKRCKGSIDTEGYCSSCGRKWRRKKSKRHAKQENCRNDSLNTSPKRGFVCGSCGYIAEINKLPKHNFWGRLVCPECKGKKFYETVCQHCKYIVGMGKPLMHNILGGLICPECRTCLVEYNRKTFVENR